MCHKEEWQCLSWAWTLKTYWLTLSQPLFPPVTTSKPYAEVTAWQDEKRPDLWVNKCLGVIVSPVVKLSCAMCWGSGTVIAEKLVHIYPGTSPLGVCLPLSAIPSDTLDLPTARRWVGWDAACERTLSLGFLSSFPWILRWCQYRNGKIIFNLSSMWVLRKYKPSLKITPNAGEWQGWLTR